MGVRYGKVAALRQGTKAGEGTPREWGPAACINCGGRVLMPCEVTFSGGTRIPSEHEGVHVDVYVCKC